MLRHIKKFWNRFQNDPVLMRKINGWLAVLWLLASVPICIFFSTSVPFLVFISVYAIVAAHWSSWQGARVEVNQAEEDIVSDIVKELDEHTDVTVNIHN